MKRMIVVAALVFLTALYAAPVQAGGVPALPHAFYGSVTINGVPAPSGTVVEARGAGVLTGIVGNPITATQGRYGRAGALDAKLVVQGDITDGVAIEFWVSGIYTGQTYAFKSGETTRLDLALIHGDREDRKRTTAPVADTTPPAITNMSVPNIYRDSADIMWTTDEPSTSQVEYWASPSQLTPLDTAMVTSHLVHLSGLRAGTTYWYIAYSKDAAGNQWAKAGSFATVASPSPIDDTVHLLTPPYPPTTPSTPAVSGGTRLIGVLGWVLVVISLLILSLVGVGIVHVIKERKAREESKKVE